jgi:ketosteroid isomerase-like protein
MADETNGSTPNSRECSEEEIRAAYAAARAAFTAEDLQRYAQPETGDGVSFEELLVELEEIHRQHGQQKGSG